MSLLNLIFVLALSGAPTSPDDSYMKCVDSTSTNPAWAGCGETYLKRLDAALNAAWKKAFASLDASGRKQLLQEQRAWLRFKEASCTVYSNGSFGREGQVLHFYGCRAAILKARASDLNGLYDLVHQDEDPAR